MASSMKYGLVYGVWPKHAKKLIFERNSKFWRCFSLRIPLKGQQLIDYWVTGNRTILTKVLDAQFVSIFGHYCALLFCIDLDITPGGETDGIRLLFITWIHKRMNILTIVDNVLMYKCFELVLTLQIHIRVLDL